MSGARPPRRSPRSRSHRAARSTPARRAARRPSGTRRKQKLVCPFCGTESPYTIDPARPARSRRSISSRRCASCPTTLRGWQAETRSVQCQSCRAVMVFDPARVGQNCEFCGSPALVRLQGDQGRRSARRACCRSACADTAVREQIRRWYASKWFAPGNAEAHALVDTVHGLYLPYWTFDAQAHCPWRAEAGHYYYTTETYRDNQGQTADAAGAARALGAGVGPRRSLLRRRAGAGIAGACASICCDRSSRSRRRNRALRHRDALGLRRRALPGGAARRGAALASSR